MNTAEQMFKNAMLHWRDNKGIGTALIPKPLDDKAMILGLLQLMYVRSPTLKTVIFTNTFYERQELIEYLTNQEDKDNNEEFTKLLNNKNLKILTIDFVIRQISRYDCDFCVIYHPDKAYETMLNYLRYTKFKLIILNKLFEDNNDALEYYKLCPLLDDFKSYEISELHLSTPVEETQIGVDIPITSNAYELLNKYNEYISASMAIFGSFDIMQQARSGNPTLNISANQICATIAQENGWNENLDMSIEFNIEIDKLYNPMALKERASQTYEIIRNRSQLLSDYDDKLEKILDIVKENPTKKILIISKRGEFASHITEYLNCLSIAPICGNYHDKVDDIPAVDEYDLPVYYKSGLKRGQRKMLGYQAQKTRNVNLFNNDELQILSTNNAPDKNLNINVDIIIITSPQCESIKSYMYRMDKLCYPNNSIKLYTLFCKNTMEEKLLETKERAKNHTIINKCEKTLNNEEYSDFVVVD